MIFSYLLNMQSHPSWVCGLKHLGLQVMMRTFCVTPFVGVWIETESLYTFEEQSQSHTLRGCVD